MIVLPLWLQALRLGAVLVLGSSAPAPAGAQGPGAVAPGPALGTTLESLLEHARLNNPDLRTQSREARAARERVGAAGALPDPRFQIELMDVTNEGNPGESASLLPGEVGETRYRIVQPIPFYGKRRLRTELADAQATQAEASLEQVAVEVEQAIKVAYANYYAAVRQERILRDTLELMRSIESLALTRYGVGLVPQQDVLRAQSETTRLKIELVQADRRRREAVSQLAASLALDADAAIAEPGALPPLPEIPSQSELLRRAAERSPQLAQQRHGVTAAERERDLAYRQRYPDLELGLTNNRPSSGAESWDVMLQVEIPLQQSARRAQEREADERRALARARVRATETRLGGRIGTALAGYRSSRDSARLLSATLLPQAQATLESALADYETGRVSFGALLEAEGRILETRLQVLEAQVEAAIWMAELEALIGERL